MSIENGSPTEHSNKIADKLGETIDGTNMPKVSSKTRLETSSSQKALRSKHRSSVKKTKDTKQLSPTVPRSNTSNLNRSHVNHHNDPSFDLTPQQWNFINNYPANFGTSNGHIITNYITEIYDRATNRFVPTTCY